MSRRLAAVVAHPDDDTWGVAGTVALHAEDPDFRFVLVHVTSGEAGEIAEGSGATRETLGRVREEEDRRSWIALGREPDRHEWLRLPDHRVEDQPYDELVGRIAAILREERPDVVITFGPDGITAHPDHVAVGRATTDAFHALGDLERPRRLLYNVLSQSRVDAWNGRLITAGREPFDPGRLYHPRGVPDDTVGVVVDCSAVVERKRAALQQHVTQAGDDDGLTEDDERQALAAEAFVVAWPSREPGTPVLEDVFEGL